MEHNLEVRWKKFEPIFGTVREIDLDGNIHMEDRQCYRFQNDQWLMIYEGLKNKGPILKKYCTGVLKT